MGKYEKYGRAAEELFVGGKTIEQIAALLPISRKSVGEWSSKYSWEAKRQLRATSPGEIAAMTLDVLRAKLETIKGMNPADIDASVIDGLYKLVKLAENIAKETRLLDKAVIVMDSYIDYCALTLPMEDMKIEFDRIHNYLTSLEG